MSIIFGECGLFRFGYVIETLNFSTFVQLWNVSKQNIRNLVLQRNYYGISDIHHDFDKQSN